MKKGAILLNTSRGDVVDETRPARRLSTPAPYALVWTCSPTSRASGDGRLGLAARPATPTSSRPTTSAPPPTQAQRAIAAGVTEIVDAFMAGEARHCVNLDPDRLGSMTLTVRHLDRVGVLAQVLDKLSSAGLNVEHMVNRVFRGGEAAVASIDVAGQATDALLADLRAIPHVLGVSVVTLGEDAERGP